MRSVLGVQGGHSSSERGEGHLPRHIRGLLGPVRQELPCRTNPALCHRLIKSLGDALVFLDELLHRRLIEERRVEHVRHATVGLFEATANGLNHEGRTLPLVVVRLLCDQLGFFG